MFLRTLICAQRGDLVARASQALEAAGAIADPVASLDELRQRLAGEPCDLAVVDLPDPPSGAPDRVAELRELPEGPQVIVLVAEEDKELRAALLAAGAYAVLNRELDERLFADALGSLAERLLDETRVRLQPVPDEEYRLSDYATRSPAMQEVLRSARRIAERDTTVLLLGETGVGKGLLARSLHNEGPRRDAPFVAVNCGALTETLLEAELFGHERGAFTGADRARRGYFELAQRGTVFLDEVAEMPAHLQVRLLHVLEERRVRPVGSEKKIDVDVRLIAATNRNLAEEVREGRFREDLYYRLNVVTLTLPPLRERREDIPEIAQSYLEHFRARTACEAEKLSDAAVEAVCDYPWPGNVRELANSMERAVIMSRGAEIQLEDLPLDVQTMAPHAARERPGARSREADPDWLTRAWSSVRRQVLEESERAYLQALLQDTRGAVGETATRAGMDPRSLYQKMRKYGLKKEDFR